MAAATMLLVCLRVARVRNRPDRRCWAAHARAMTAGSRPCWRRAISTPTEAGAGRTRPTQVRSRRDLVAKVFFAHYEPRLRDNERRALKHVLSAAAIPRSGW